MDVEGNAVTDKKEYVFKILMIGEGYNQLSILESNKLMLAEKGIYEGYYEGVIFWLSDIPTETGGPFAISVQFLSVGESRYEGETNSRNSEYGLASFEVKEAVILKFTLSDGLSADRLFQWGIPSVQVIATGIVKDDLILEIAMDKCDNPEFEFVGGGFSLKRVIPD